jgi:uncharacterized membrane protein
MNRKQRKRLTWILVALGGAAIALCVILLVAAPADWAQYHANGKCSHHPWMVPGAAQPDGQPGAWAKHGKGGHFGPLLVAGAVILIAALAFGRHRKGRQPGHEPAEELLKRQFAEGKITEEEYRSRLSAIRE